MKFKKCTYVSFFKNSNMLTMIEWWSISLSKIVAIDVLFLITKICCEPNENEITIIVPPLRFCASSCESCWKMRGSEIRSMNSIRVKGRPLHRQRGIDLVHLFEWQPFWKRNCISQIFPLSLVAPLSWLSSSHLRQLYLLLSHPSPLQDERLVETQETTCNYANGILPCPQLCPSKTTQFTFYGPSRTVQREIIHYYYSICKELPLYVPWEIYTSILNYNENCDVNYIGY